MSGAVTTSRGSSDAATGATAPLAVDVSGESTAAGRAGVTTGATIAATGYTTAATV